MARPSEMRLRRCSPRARTRGYVLDDHGAIRKHVCIFADGQRLNRDATLGHPIEPQSQIHVMQALSGG
jgi:hypothetical protein